MVWYLISPRNSKRPMNEISQRQPEHGSGHLTAGPFAIQFALVVALICGLSILYANTFGVDTADDLFFRQAGNGTYGLALASYVNGRFIPGGIFHLISLSGVEIHQVWTMVQIVTVATIAAFSVLFVTCLKVPLSSVETFIFAALIATFPYLIDLLANQNNAVNGILAYSAIGAAIYCYGRMTGWGRVLVPAFFIFICVSSYQTTLYYFIAFVCGFLLFHSNNWREVGTSVAAAVTACLLGLIFYFIVYRMVLDWALPEIANSGNPELVKYYGRPRSQVNDLAGFLRSGLVYIISVVRSLFWHEPILPIVLKLFALGVFLVSYHFWTDEPRAGTPQNDNEQFLYRKRRLLLLALILATGSPIHLLIANNWIAPRVVAQTGAIWSVFLIAALLFGPQKWRNRFAMGAAIFTAGSTFYTAVTLYDAKQLYQKDMAFGRQIIKELQEYRDFDFANPIAIVGRLDSASPYMKNMVSYFDTNVSKFGNEWSKRVILEAASNRPVLPPDATFFRTAQDFCAKAETDQAYYRTAVLERGAVVCLISSKSESKDIPK